MEKLIELLEDICPDIDFRGNDHLIDDKLLDSLDIVTIVSEIGYVFDIQITADEIIPENFNSADAMYRLITKTQEKDS